MTFKSINGIVEELTNAGQLYAYVPLTPGVAIRRYLFLTREIFDEVNNADIWRDPAVGHRYGQLEADFERYASGQDIAVGLDPKKKDRSAFMARLCPVEKGLWSIRSVAPSPAIRVFCAFVDPDVLVCLCTSLRRSLGGMCDRRWRNRIMDAESRWDLLFPNHTRLSADEVGSYVKENATPC